MPKECGHPDHPEDGNVGVADSVTSLRARNRAAVEEHKSDLPWFVNRTVKAGFPIREGSERCEWMWVEVTGSGEGQLTGKLVNHPVVARHLSWGQAVTFPIDRVLDVL